VNGKMECFKREGLASHDLGSNRVARWAWTEGLCVSILNQGRHGGEALQAGERRRAKNG